MTLSARLSAFLTALLLAAPAAAQEGKAGDKIRVGFIDEITLKDGKTKSWGYYSLLGAELALKDYPHLMLVPRNVQRSPIMAKEAAEELGKASVEVSLGLRTAVQGMMAKKAAEPFKMPLVIVMATSDNLFTKPGHTFGLAARNSYQIEALTRFLTRNPKAIKDSEVGVVVTKNCLYCVEMEQQLGKALAPHGIKTKRLASLLHNVPISPEIFANGVKHTHIALFTDEVEGVSLIRRLAKTGFKGTIVGGDSWSVQNTGMREESALPGICLVNALSYDKSAVTKENQAFIEAYRKAYGSDPNDLAALAYDAARAIGEASRDCVEVSGTAARRACVEQGLRKVRFRGATGLVRFEADGSRPRSKDYIITHGCSER